MWILSHEKWFRVILTSYFWIILLSWTQRHGVYGVLMEELAILDELLNQGYDRRATPTNHLNNTTPTKVYCQLFVRSFGSPNPLTMDYKVDLYLRQKWRDERLQHVKLRQPLDLSDPNLVKAIWKPEVYFPNAKEADFQFVTVPNVLVRINPEGEILYMLRLKVTFSCMMNLSKFPLDRQQCTMEVASFSKTLDELVLEWQKENPVTTADLGMSQFELDKIDTKLCPSTESFGQIGNYSCIVATFHLSRSLGFHLVQSYLPTILMVVISWVSFWMDVNSVPGRVTLGITTLLTVSHKSTNIQENLPQSSYVKAIDVWMGTCTAFVFLALLEFTVVNYLWRKESHERSNSAYRQSRGRSGSRNPDARNQMEIEGYDHSPTLGNTLVQVREKDLSANHLEAKFIPGTGHGQHGSRSGSFITTSGGGPDLQNTGEESASAYKISFFNFPLRASTIDETCRFAFPLAFASFNCLYWPYYLLT